MGDLNVYNRSLALKPIDFITKRTRSAGCICVLGGSLMS
jgi:hypothetical protein